VDRQLPQYNTWLLWKPRPIVLIRTEGELLCNSKYSGVSLRIVNRYKLQESYFSIVSRYNYLRSCLRIVNRYNNLRSSFGIVVRYKS